MTKIQLIAGLLAGAVSVGVLPAVANAQAPAPIPLSKPVVQKGYVVPRASDGHADLQGNWTNAYITRLERPADAKGLVYSKEEAAKLEGAALGRFVEGNAPTDPNAPATDTTAKQCQGAGGLDCGYNSGWKDSGTKLAWVHGEPRSSFLTSTPDGRLPAMVPGAARFGRRFVDNDQGEGSPGDRPQARPAVAAAPARGATRSQAAAVQTGGRPGQNDNPEGRSLGERCLMSFGNSAGPVMLPLMYNNTYQIVQTKDAVAILVEMVHDTRIVRMNQPHRTDGVRTWMGDSVGHWEGDTLVVETTNYHPLQNFRGSSENLKVTERFTRVAPDRLLYQFTAEDPTVWTQPWSGEYEFGTASGGVYEYACHEGNYGLEGILAGAREQERQDAAAAANRRAEGPATTTAQ